MPAGSENGRTAATGDLCRGAIEGCHRLARAPHDRGGGAVESGHALAPIQHDQPGPHAVEHEVAKGLEVAQVALSRLEFSIRGTIALSHASDQDRDHEEGGGVQEDRHDLEGGGFERRLEEVRHRENRASEDEPAVQQRCERGDGEGTDAREEGACAGDGQDVEERIDRAGTARGCDHRRDEDDVERRDQRSNAAGVQSRATQEDGGRGPSRHEERQRQDRNVGNGRELGRRQRDRDEQEAGQGEPRPRECP